MAAQSPVLLPRELHTTDRPSATAQWTTLGRSLELTRPAAQRIVDDPFAPVFLTPASRAVLAPLRAAGPVVRRAERWPAASLATAAPCRHAFVDAHLLAALPGCDQVVVLGAGYDSRAYRFAGELGGRAVYEVDLAPLSRRKADVVAAHPDVFGPPAVTRVEIDFRTQSLAERLTAGGFEAGRPTVVVWEGVSMYLTEDAVTATLRALHGLCGRGSVLAMDFWQHVPGRRVYDRARRVGERAIRLIGEPLTFAVPADGVAALLAAAGFTQVDRAWGDGLARRHSTGGRPCDPGLHLAAARID